MCRAKLIISGFILIFSIMNCTSNPGTTPMVPPYETTHLSTITSDKIVSKKPVYTHIVNHEFSKEESFQLISQWLAESYSTREIYTDYINEEKGKIIGSVILPFKKGGFKAPVKLVYIIETKDNRFRLTAKNFIMGEYQEFWFLVNEHKVKDPKELSLIYSQIKEQMLAPMCKYMKDSKQPDNW